MPEQVSFTKQELQDFMATVIKSAVAEATRMNPLEEKKYKEALEAEARKTKMVAELGRIEEQAQKDKKNRCSHTRDKEGNPVAKGTGVWTTQGQVHGNDTITLVCLRCGNSWHWQATAQERDFAQNGAHGLLGFPPPEEERLLKTA